MSLKHVFRKYFLLTVGILFAFMMLANFMMNLILRQTDSRPPMRSPLFFARLLDDLGPDRVKNLKHLEALNEASLPFHFLLLDQSGKILAGDETVLPTHWNKRTLPSKPFEFIQLGPDFEPRPLFPTFMPVGKMGVGPDHGGGPHGMGGPGFPPPGEGGPGEMGPPGGPGGREHERANQDAIGHLPAPHDQLIRLPGDPAQFLVVHFKVDEATLKRRPPSQVFALSFVLLVCSVLLGVGASLAFIFRSLGKNVALADSVIAELQKGNLKARFPIKKRDEFGAAMMRFNQMADEIELLVERLVNTEKSRMTLLQELAHDLRTPVASLKNLLETLQTREGSLEPQVKTELISLSVKEIDYFERLIEDLLILAQVSEPRYHAKTQSTDLVAILVDEAESAVLHSIPEKSKVALIKDVQTDSLFTQGDPLLIRRMFRNVLLNAYSFAKHQVKVTLHTASGATHATIIVEDDGPGFTEDGIKNFGIRRMTRVLGTDKSGRLSVGLGSVIAKTLAELHRGSITVENRLDSSGNVVGARVTFTLNLFA